MFIQIVQSVTGTTLTEDAAEGTNKPADTTTTAKNPSPSPELPPLTAPKQRTRVRCGCSDAFLKGIALIAFVLFVAGIATGAGLVSATSVGAALSLCFAIIFMIIWVVMLSLLFCMSCRYPVEEA